MHLLVEVVTNPGRITEQVLNGDALVNERQVVAEQLTSPKIERQPIRSDDRGEALRAARYGELGIDRVRDGMRTVCIAKCPRLVADAHDARKPFGRERERT